MRLRIIISGLLFAVIAGAIACHLLLKTQVQTPEFKSFAESKVGDFLGAKVRIARIQARFINQVKLTGLEISPKEQNGSSYRVRVQQVIFRYSIWHLVTLNLKTPKSVVLKTPKISVSGESFPYGFLENLNFGKDSSSVMAHLELEGGAMRFKIPELSGELEVSDVHGAFQSLEQGKIHIHFRAQLGGILEGKVSLSGEVDPAGKNHHLNLNLQSVDFGSRFPIPLKGVSGKIRWENDSFYYDSLTASLHGWKVQLGGKIEHLASKPVLTLRWLFGGSKKPFEGMLKADLGREVLIHRVETNGNFRFDLEGRIRQEGLKFIFPRLRLNNLYSGTGQLDFDSGNYRLSFEKKNERFSVESNLRNLNFDFRVHLDHFKLFGLDLATATRFHLTPVLSQWDKRVSKFHGNFETDYFILEYAPFDDLRGSFEMTRQGIKSLKAAWGEVFQLDGSLSLQSAVPEADLTVKAHGFSLQNVREFAAKPLPKKLAGMLEGKLKIEGSIAKPEISGRFTVKEGQLGKLKYDMGIIQFRGYPPYLKLYDSHILKGRATFLLTGALDLSLSNMFRGIQIHTPDNFILWKGWEMTGSETQSDLEIQTPDGKFPMIGLKVGEDNPDGVLNDAQNKDEKNYLVAGPRFKF